MSTSTRIQRATLGALAAVTAAALTAGCSDKAEAADPETLLDCSGGQVTSTNVDHDDTTKETRTPQELAAAWAAAQGGAFSGGRKVAYKSDERTDITFADGQGKATAVLSYRNDDRLGWRLEKALNCA
ncbi:hypothetical protein GA0070624_4095 [Micromonospora rhizosphaerae]|uniref:Lipoprotein n=1 Tax=Micromonospora rhizosphaerae TaxID=568872 RepID=A0A1C6SME3_9ACTN|nr:hypothetical protein [Micromonospora rhizosphaerae]SCL30533.1 hypothetical protein GA0070624_4095 [Micromonospora rhizosphaerae]